MREPVVVIVAVGVLACSTGAALAQSQTPGGMPPPPGMSMRQSSAMRFPQPVQVGTLIGRDVRQPVESQRSLGHVRDVVRLPGGEIAMVIEYGGVLGVGGRQIALPIDSMVLLGDVVEPVMDTPHQLAQLPRFDPAGSRPLPRDAEIKIGLAKPSH
jgi:hypothetical protein